MHKIVTKPLDFPHFLLALPFDDFQAVSNNYWIKAKIYTYFDSITEVTINLLYQPVNPGDTIDLRNPLNFKRLELHKTKNIEYKSRDLEEIEAIFLDETYQLYVFKEDKAFACVDSYFVSFEDYSCGDCPQISATEEYSMFFGISDIKGFCNKLCTTGEICITHNLSLQNLKNTFSCVSATDTKAYFTCEPQDPTTTFNFSQNNHLYYNSLHSPANIVFNQANMIGKKSYMIEFWFMADANYTFLTNIPTLLGLHNYIFFSNAIRIYLDTASGLNVYFAYSSHNPNAPINITAQMNLYEWNHIIAQVEFLNNRYYMRLIFNNNISNIIQLGNTTNDMSFMGMYMCNLESSSCFSAYGNFYWASGYYKDLRFWDSDLTSYASIFTYNELSLYN